MNELMVIIFTIIILVCGFSIYVFITCWYDKRRNNKLRIKAPEVLKQILKEYIKMVKNPDFTGCPPQETIKNTPIYLMGSYSPPDLSILYNIHLKSADGYLNYLLFSSDWGQINLGQVAVFLRQVDRDNPSHIMNDIARAAGYKWSYVRKIIDLVAPPPPTPWWMRQEEQTSPDAVMLAVTYPFTVFGKMVSQLFRRN